MGDRDPSTAGCFPCQALLNFPACLGTAGITEAQLLRCLRKEVVLFFCPLGFLQGMHIPSINSFLICSGLLCTGPRST